jgi:hypothetical protein
MASQTSHSEGSFFPTDFGIFETIPNTLARRTPRIGEQCFASSSERRFLCCQAGAVALVAGKLVVAADVVANHRSLAVQAAANKGDKTIKVTLGATAFTSGQYAGAYIHFITGTGAGMSPLRVLSHTVTAATGVATIKLMDGLPAAIDTTTRVTFRYAPGKAVVISITDGADLAIGVPLVAVAANYYFWALTRGIGSVLVDQTWSRGQVLTIGSGTAGGLMPRAGYTQQVVATADDAGAIGSYSPVMLTL